MIESNNFTSDIAAKQQNFFEDVIRDREGEPHERGNTVIKLDGDQLRQKTVHFASENESGSVNSESD